MKNYVLAVLLLLAASTSFAQTVKETFDSNSLDWTESPKGKWGSAVINKGVMTVTSKERRGVTSRMETHCYAPLEMKRPFRITTHVHLGELDEDDDQQVGLIFNYKDFGNYYAFVLNENNVDFLRVEDEELVGHISQGIKWPKRRLKDQAWEIRYDGNELMFLIDEAPIFKVRYMEMQYRGFGFYTSGQQKLVVEDVEFVQN